MKEDRAKEFYKKTPSRKRILEQKCPVLCEQKNLAQQISQGDPGHGGQREGAKDKDSLATGARTSFVPEVTGSARSKRFGLSYCERRSKCNPVETFFEVILRRWLGLDR